MADCLDLPTLQAFAQGEIPDEASARIETHLETCRRCAERLAKLPHDD